MKKILMPEERLVYQSLTTPDKIQMYLESLPTNFEEHGETNLSPRSVIREQRAHCFEGAVFAAAVLAYHGEVPLLMDFATTYDDEDHTIALFRRNDHWGAISKTNHGVLRYRDPVYKTTRELAMSYFHEYYMYDGRKSMRAYSLPFDLRQLDPSEWVCAEGPRALDFLMERLAASMYSDAIPPHSVRYLRRATPLERRLLSEHEWPDPRPKMTDRDD